MARQRFSLRTTLYGRRLVSRAQLYELHREVASAASLARMSDPLWVERHDSGVAAWRQFADYRALRSDESVAVP